MIKNKKINLLNHFSPRIKLIYICHLNKLRK